MYTSILSSESGFFADKLKRSAGRTDRTLALVGVHISIFETFVKWGISDSNDIILTTEVEHVITKEQKDKRVMQLLNECVDCYILALKIDAPRFRTAVIDKFENLLNDVDFDWLPPKGFSRARIQEHSSWLTSSPACC